MEQGQQISQRRKAYVSIRNMIVEQQIKPGYPIWETDLAEQLGMSRTPVREALQRLRSEGLVLHVKNKGLFVKDLTSEEIEQNYQLTEALESMVAYLLAKQQDPECLEELERCAKGMEDCLDGERNDEWTEYDACYHDAMLKHCPNKCITAVQERTNVLIKNVRIRYTRLLLDREKSTQAHRALTEAIKAGDADAAREIWQAHLSVVSAQIKRLL